MTGPERETLRRRIDQATRAGLRPARFDARPGFFGRTMIEVVNTGREVLPYPTLAELDAGGAHHPPKILGALNG